MQYKVKIPLRQQKVTILLWQVPQEIQLAGSPKPAQNREEPAQVSEKPARVEGNLPI